MAHMYRSDTARTAERVQRYDDYMRAEVLTANRDFACTSGLECRNAARAEHPGCSYYEGQLGYIGDHYDMSVDGIPWRMLFVGMELGGKIAPYSRIDRIRRSQDHTRAYEPWERNRHMKGVMLGVRYALGLGAQVDPSSEYITIAGKPDRAVHALECYALMNARLCSATIRPRSNSSAGVNLMTRNCFPHLRAVIEILEPTLIVVQGIGVWRELSPLLPGNDIHDGDIALRRVNAPVRTLVAKLSHPRADSYPWREPDDWYFRQVVQPTLSTAVRITRDEAGR